MDSKRRTNSPGVEGNELSLTDLFHIVWLNWYWFVLSVVVCVGLAVLYLKWAPKVYTRTATVLIKDETKGGGGLSETAAFEELNLFNVKRNVDNEVLIFKAKRLMTEVARRLHLDVSYTVKEGLRTMELYTRSPLTVSFPETEESQSFSFRVTPVSQKEVFLSDFAVAGEKVTPEKVFKAPLNDTLKTPVGKMVIVPTLYYSDKYYGTDIEVTKSNLIDVAEGYRNNLQAVLPEKTATLISLSLQDVSIPRAEDVLNTLIAVYNEDAINDKNQIAVNTSNFINDRLIIIEKELGNVDADIETYKKENQLTDITSETGMYLETTSQFRQQGLSLENQLSLARYIKEYLQDPRKSSDLIPANTGISDINVETQIGEYNEMLLKRDKLISNSSNKNPVVMDLNNSLSAMKQTIIRSVDNLIVGLGIKLKNIRAQEDQTSRRISAVPTQQKYVLSIERQQKIKEELYLYLLNKREENALTQAITESNARIIDPASGSNLPVTPQTKNILLVALCAGLALPAAFFFVRASLDMKVHTRKDIENAVSIPFLGEIPMKDKKEKENVVVKENSRDAVSEAFRIIRTNMEFMRVASKNMQVIAFTSANAGSGKTFVSTNLAVSIALTRKKVILVDLDIRKGALTGSNAQGTRIGITNYLSEKIDDINEIINPSEWQEGLDIIYSGPVPPNPAELLLSERLDHLIEALRERYDYIILDNVPATVVADAAIINRVADLTIYIVRSGRMDRRQLPDLEKLYEENKFRNLSVVLNAIPYKSRGYGYGYGYGYEYGYGYGYGYAGGKKH